MDAPNFRAAITRCPLPLEDGDEAAAQVPGQPPEVAEVLRGAAGCSPYLRGLIGQEAGWLAEALAAPHDAVLPALLADVEALAPDEAGPGLRRLKRRLALYAGLADLAGVWPLETVTHALTAFADASVGKALNAALLPLLARGKVPGHGEDAAADAAGMVVLAMGKMGAFELNYSSDIDLIVLFDDDRFPGDAVGEARAAFVRATRAMTALLQDKTEEGYVWRTDLRLRPDPAVTPVCLSMEAAERYYESLGRTWERAAHIKARPCAGDIAAGGRYLERLRPFVWRRHLDFAAIEDAHDMRRRIREHKGLHEDERLEGRDLKLGVGGIREIEFFAQTRQLIAGGRDPDLRARGTVDALARLSDKGWVPAEVSDTLCAHYRVLREAEHRLQMIADARTQTLPTSAAGFDRLARLSGAADTKRWRDALSAVMAEVHGLTEEFFARRGGGAPPPEAGPEPEIVARWRHYPALRSSRAQRIFERLKPDLLARLAAADRPDEALAAFDGFLRGLPAGVQLFAMFEANPHLRALITDIAASAPALASYLSRNSRVLEGVVSGDFFAPWPGRAALADGLRGVLGDAPDYEARLDRARLWAKEWHFRVGVHHLQGLVDADEAGTQYADLAAASLHALLPVVVEEFAAKHGPPPGRGLAVLAMGSLGAGWITAGSDLDLIVVYDPAGAEMSEGRRPLAPRPYYARLTQALVTAVSAPTAQGRLYEVDMRLRPSGKQGPVATSLAAFERYQQEEAWTWEHMALTRATPVAGSAEVCAEAEAVRAAVLARPRARDEVWQELARMRGRLAAARGAAGPLDVKPGPGGLQDIELLGQAGALLAGASARSTPAQLAAAARAGVLDRDAADRLAASYRFGRAVLSAGRLVHHGELSPEALGQGARNVILREAGMADMDALARALAARRAEAAGLIEATLGPATADAGGSAEGSA
jgi:glutamate-ammonia-ligase adenylyltransferase